MRMARPASRIRPFAETLFDTLETKAPPTPVIEIAEKLGAIVIFKIFPKKSDLSGMLYRDENMTAVIAVNSRHSETRQRFTVAHEIGHLLLHKGKDVFVDRSFKASINLRSSDRNGDYDADEIEANRFAAELLMPRKLLLSDIRRLGPSIDVEDEAGIAKLAEQYQVSRQAMTFRIQNILST